MEHIVRIKDILGDFLIDSLFIKGVRRNLEESDLCQVRGQLKGEHINNCIENDWKFISEHTNGSTGNGSNTVYILKWLLVKSVCINFLITGVFLFLEHSLNLVKDLLLAALVTQKIGSAFNVTNMNMNISNATQLNLETSVTTDITLTACVLIGATLGELIASNLKVYFDSFSSTYLRILFETIIYAKLLKIKNRALKGINVIHLISSDTQIFREGIATIHILWIAPIEVASVIFFMWTRLELHSSVVPGVLFLTILSILQVSFSHRFQSMRKQMLHYGDKRVEVVENLVANFTLVRLLGWEKPITKLVYEKKNIEDAYLKKVSLIRALKLIFFFIGPTISIYLTALTYSLITEEQITAGQVNAGFLMFAQLSSTLVLEFNHAIYLIREVNLSLKRIAALLDSPEYGAIQDNKPTKCKDVGQNTREQPLKNGISGNSPDQTAYLKISSNIDNSISIVLRAEQSGNVLGVSGNITAGNSDLLLSIFGELDVPQNLNIEKKGSIVFIPKEPWFFDGNVKENIIFNSEFDKEWYIKVKELCGIIEEFKYSNVDDNTQVMDEAGLKGPLAMKICIARAIYKKADIYLLDDVFGLIDLKSSIQIFKNLISEILCDKIVLIATNQLEILNLVTKEIKMKDGEIQAISASHKQQEHRVEETEESHEEKTNNRKFRKCGKIMRQRSMNFTTSIDTKANWEDIYHVKEDKKIHNISLKTYLVYLLSGSNLAILYILVILVLLAETSNIISLLGWFFLPMNNLQTVTVLDTMNISSNVTSIINQEWKTYIVVTVFVIVSILCYLILCITIIFILLRCSDAMHDKMFFSVLEANTSFFIRTPVGTILNRFIRDITVCDELLPYHFTFFTVLSFQALGVIALTFTINQSILVPTLIIIVSILLVFRWVYLKTSRSIRSLESNTCIPLYSHCNITVNGILTIQAHKCQKKLMAHFIQCQDNYSNAYYSNHMVNIWVGIRVGLIGIFTLTLVTTVILKVSSANFIGATTLGQMILALWMLKHWMLLSIEVENEMISVQRLLSYQNLPSKTEIEDPVKVSTDWPTKPTIEFDDVTLSFAPYLPNMLQQISFTINSGEVIGIVGKNSSAVLAAIMCLNEFSGTIKIDDCDISKIDPHVLRNCISIVPIDCLVLPGSLRLNLDPFNRVTDKELWEIIEITELKSVITSLPEQLSFDMSKFNQYFSAGQRKLFSLARALIEKKNMLIIDSAINSLDQDTEDKVHKIIRTHCIGKTVIYLTDRLIKLASCEKVLILNGPKKQEYDTLTNLINKEESEVSHILKSLYHQESVQFASNANTNSRRRSFTKSTKEHNAFSKVNFDL